MPSRCRWFRAVEPEHLEKRLGEERLLMLIEKAKDEVAAKQARIVRMMRYAGQRWDAPEMLEQAQQLEAETRLLLDDEEE